MPVKRRLDLPAVERALREVQGHFVELSRHFTEPRDPLTDEVLENVLEGYALIDDYVARDIDLFELQHLNLMLELNATVLCGQKPAGRLEYAQHLAATEAHFFNNIEGGIKDVFNWYCAHRNESVWKRAAGVYVRILSKPQLFIEGNNRTGSLIVSYLLMRAGLPPFVLSLKNAEGYFNPSSVIRNSAKHGVKALYELPKIKKKYAAFLEEQSPEPKKFFLSEKKLDAERRKA
ncbi:hypothetical protein D16iCDA_19835 [Pseudomonas seleniipraecipitans]|uniref:Fido domain-containing protein n=1 Tax=Phytopseudomonas seleniipraecipitans TaxID=640205 RepID=A0ABY5JBR7_9GAMM|nr:hypothetical protein [Pseudomonas seleniipraecipitans]NQD78720.1 hypothetical protein [Pseudomonas sp. CrR14]UUD63895.1 hypothetical protein D16iCDA_19835 [Pseudomonas seleniipraecipitans]